MTEWLISVGTGNNQIPLIRKARELGYKIIGLDRSPNKQEIDEWLKISTYDYSEAFSRILHLQKKKNFKGVLARVSGPAVKMQSFLAEGLALLTGSIMK